MLPKLVVISYFSNHLLPRAAYLFQSQH